LVIGLFDSEGSSGGGRGSGGAMHSSVDLVGEGVDGLEPRESLELRCLAVW
jgi:hypothetical protein